MGSTVEFGQRGKGSGQTPRPPVWSSKFQIQISSRTSGREWAIHATCAAVGTYLRSRSASSMRNEKERRRHLVCASLKAYVRTSCSESLCDTHTLTVHTVIILRLMEAGTCAAMAAAFDFV
ncbi:hypothetical protein M0657_008589 [Pyricularia oryzae]|uniref:Uncharacterized protein n=1 Tax=Pyricularia oryzae TaxID=318829 RepID=A0A4P7NBQ3_PYROR|nr:hypothetical protein MCOR06_006921 [Pyricularia oryzae]KAI7916450.1 hypothetical protein M0657_008589 [Pyricularia oryzae]KAI7924967.1 hypothetical protein M9X92_003543 [Pyricularia oryzae]QBZ58891.1 hypothetical protein PoMZ_03849 [Pyricularia oryzae]